MPEELYNTPSSNGVASGWLAVNGVGQQDQSLQGMNEDTKAYIETLSPEERKKAIDDFNAPLSGMEVYEALKQSQDFKPTHEEYTKYLAYDKEHKTSVLEGLGQLGEGMSAVMGDLGRAAGAVIDHPMSGLAKAPTSLIEAFAQGTRNLYGMVAQSASPDSVLFKMKNALAGDGTVDGYNQFLEARRFLKNSANLASGKETLVMDKDVIDHDMTLAMSYVADPTLFIPFGSAASAGMKAIGMGEKIALLGSRAASIKAAVIGGGLKWGVGAPIEAIANVTRNTIERGAALGGAVLETTTGISAAELKATAKLSAAGTSTASALGGHIPIVSDISNVYVASGAARGFGEAIGAVGEQIQKRGFKRGYDSFAREALEQTAGLSPHAQGLLKVLDAIDPMMSYGYGTAVGAGHGALIGGTLGYLNAGEEGMYQGMGAGIALGATGAVGGRMFADVSGGTKMARAEVQGHFNLESMRADKHQNLPAAELLLEMGTRNGDRAGALQVLGGLGRVAPDLRLLLGNVESQKRLLQSKGLNADGHKVDPVTGRVEMRNGKPVQYEAPLAGFYGGEGFTMHTEKDGNGKQQVTVVINTDALAGGSKNVIHHELFHAVFRTTVMEKMFRDDFAGAILGKFDVNGIKVKDSEINPKEFRAFVEREMGATVDTVTGKQFRDLPPKVMADKMREFDAHLAEYQKAGTTSKMPEASAKKLNDLVEEFAAHYATQFMKGKPVDYLFRGAEYTGMQGVMDRLHNNFLDFWQGQVGRQNPTFGDFSKGFDASFGPNKGKRTLEQRSAALDYMVQDLIRSASGKRKGSTNSFDVRTMSPEARNAYFNSSGMDGVRAYYDKDGNLRNVTEAQVTAERLEVGKAIHESLSKLDPKETAGLADADGNFGSSSTLGTKFNDTVLTHLVKEGHISQQLAERIKTVQDIVSGQGSNRVSYLYKGESMETEVGPNSPRVRGAAVPITARETIVVGYKITIKKDGTMSLVMKGLDAKVMDERGNIQWAKPEVRALWQGDRNAFDQSFMEYLSNASKASNDKTRVESSLLPLLARGDGLGGERRNVMHQFLGMAKRKSAGYINTPIAEIPRGKTSVVTNFTMDTMSPMRSDSPIRYDFNLDNAHSDLSRNFKVSDMDYEKTPQGDVFTHASKYKIVAVKGQQAHLYDSEGKSIGVFKDKDLASVAMEKAYKAERLEVEDRVVRVQEHQQVQQQNFKVWDTLTMEEGRRLGDIFETEQGKAFHHGTTLIRQTREEFYSDNFSKLRQADPDTVMAVTEQIAQRGYALRDLRTKAYDRVQAELAKGKGREYKLARDQYDTIVSHADRYNDILLAYERATRAKTNGQGILDYINTHRRTSTGYDNMAKVFFGDHYDSQFQTGKAVTTVATHGTSSHELLTSREFDPKQSGSKHGAEHDKVGIFLSGETKTSHGYADPKEKDFGYRQVRAAIKFNNPLVVDAQFKCYSPDVYEGYMKKVRDGGHDGVIIKNVYDGGSADTVFIINNDSVKANTAIIDTHIGMERVTRQSEQMGSVSADSDQGSVRYPIQESMPRGKDVRVGSQLGLSWKVDDTPKISPQDALKEAAFERVIPSAKIAAAKKAGRYEEGVPITRLAGRSVAVLAYDSAGVLSLADKKSGQAIEGAESFGGGMHSVRSEALGFGHTAIASTLQGVNAIIKVLASVHQKAKLAGEKHYYATILGANPDKLLSSTVGVRASNAHITQLMAKGMLSEKDVRGTLLKISSDKAFPNLGITEAMTTAEMLQSISAIFAKPLDPNAKVTAQSKGSAFKQKTAFVDAIVRELKSSDSWQANKDGIQKYFGTTESMKSNEGIKRALGLSITDPTNFDKSGNLVKNGHMFLALEFKTGKDIEWSKGGHPSYPNDIRYKDGTPVKILRFEEPMLATDAAGSKEGVDIGNKITVQKGYPKEHPLHGFQQKDASGKPLFVEQSAYTYEVPTGSGTGEMKMKKAAEMVHRDPNFNTGKNTAELGLKDLLKFKVADSKAEHITQKRKELLTDLPRYREMMVRYRDKLLSGEVGKDLEVGLENSSLNRGADFRNHLRGVDLMIDSMDSTIEFEKNMKARGQEGYYSKERVSGMENLQVDELFRSVESFAGTEFTDKVTRLNHSNQVRTYEGFQRFMESELTKDYAKPAFYSALNQTVEKIFSKTVGKDEAINPARLINLIKSASGGDIGRIMTEADAIGLTEFLKSKGQKKTSIKEIRDFIDTNKIEIEVDPKTRGVLADFGDTSAYRAKGDVLENHTFIAKINPKYAHGVAGHFSAKGDVVVHIRASIRIDADGKRVLFVEEIQSQNAQAKQVPKHEIGILKKEIKALEDFHRDMRTHQLNHEQTLQNAPLADYQTIKDNFLREKKKLFERHYPLLPETLREKYKFNREGMQEINGKEAGDQMFFETLKIGNDQGAQGVSADMSYRQLYYEKKLKLSRGESKEATAPMQDFKETVKVASRTVMRQAVELGADRVVFVESKDTHPDVDMRKERGIQLYDKDIPAMVASDIKKFGGELKPANNFDPAAAQSDSGNGYPTEGARTTHEILSRSRGYDVTPAMKETLNGQPTYKVADTAPTRAEGTPNLKPFEGNFKVSDVVKTGVAKLDEVIGRLTKTDNISPSLRDAMKALKDAVRKQDATDEVLIPELREAYDTMVRSIDDQMAGASLTPIDSLKEIQKVLKPLDKKIQKNSERIQKNARDAQAADMAEGADVESQGIQERQAAGRRDMEEGASLESDQATAEIDRRRGDARLDMEEGANLDSDQVHQQIGEYNADQNEAANVEAAQPRNQNLPPQFPNPAPPIPAGLPSYKPSGTPAFPRPPATPTLPQVKPSGAVPFPRPPATPALPRGSIAPPPPQGTPAPNPLAPSLTAAKPLGKLSAWRGWTLEKGLNGGFWKNAIGWMIVVQADKFKVYNPQKAMQGIYEDLEAAKRRVQRAEPKQ